MPHWPSAFAVPGCIVLGSCSLELGGPGKGAGVFRRETNLLRNIIAACREPCQYRLISFMATTAPKRSTYRQRRVDVMLNEGAASSPPPLPSAPQARQNLSPASHSPQSQIFSSIRPRLLFALGGIAAALLCAVLIFFALFRHDHAPASQARITVNPVTAPAPVQASAPAAPMPLVSPEKETPKQQDPLAEPVQFRIKRSKAFEKIGPIRLRLLKANTRWNTCELYINSGGPSYQKQAHLSKPVQIDFPNSAGPVELIVTGIKSDQISGSVQQK